MSQKRRKSYQITEDDDTNDSNGGSSVEEKLVNIKKVLDLCQSAVSKLSRQVETLKHTQDETNIKLEKLLDRPVAGSGEDSGKGNKLLTDIEQVLLPHV